VPTKGLDGIWKIRAPAHRIEAGDGRKAVVLTLGAHAARWPRASRPRLSFVAATERHGAHNLATPGQLDRRNVTIQNPIQKQ